MSDQADTYFYLKTQSTHKRDIHASGGIRTRSPRQQAYALDRAAFGIGKQLIFANDITSLFYGTPNFISNFSGTRHWNQAPSQGGASGCGNAPKRNLQKYQRQNC